MQINLDQMKTVNPNQIIKYLIFSLLLTIFMGSSSKAQRYVEVRTGAFYVEGEQDRQIRPFNLLNANVAFMLKPYLNAKLGLTHGSYKAAADKAVESSLLTDPVYSDYQNLTHWFSSYKFRYSYAEASIEFMPLNFILGHTDPLIEVSFSLAYGLSHHTTHLNLKDQTEVPYILPADTKNVDEQYDDSFETKFEKDQGFGTFLAVHAALKMRLDYKIDLSLEAQSHLHKTDYLDAMTFDSNEHDMVILFLVGLEFEF